MNLRPKYGKKEKGKCYKKNYFTKKITMFVIVQKSFLELFD